MPIFDRAPPNASLEECTSGMEFADGGLSRLLDSAKPGARIETLRAGTARLFR